MARTTAVQLTGEDLTPVDVWEIAVGGAAAELDDSAREKMRASRAVVERAAEAPEKTYGVNTGFGRFVNQIIRRSSWKSFNFGAAQPCLWVGDPYPDEIVRAAIVMRANTLAKGYSGGVSRSPSSCSPCSAPVCCRTFRVVARWGPAAISLRSRTSRSHL